MSLFALHLFVNSAGIRYLPHAHRPRVRARRDARRGRRRRRRVCAASWSSTGVERSPATRSRRQCRPRRRRPRGRSGSIRGVPHRLRSRRRLHARRARARLGYARGVDALRRLPGAQARAGYWHWSGATRVMAGSPICAASARRTRATTWWRGSRWCVANAWESASRGSRRSAARSHDCEHARVRLHHDRARLRAPPAPVAPAWRSRTQRDDRARRRADRAPGGRRSAIRSSTKLWSRRPTARTRPSQAAGARVLEAQARRGIAIGRLFPQQQEAFGGYQRVGLSENARQSGRRRPTSSATGRLGFDAAWELDLWGTLPARHRVVRRRAAGLGRRPTTTCW